jgi:ribonuclease P protein subunit RPR2
MTSKKEQRKHSNKFKLRKDSFQEIAEKRIIDLFSEAEKVFKEDTGLADRYVFLARKLSLKFKVPLKKEQKIKFCRKCGSFLLNGKNAKIRLSKGNLVINCGVCKTIRRFKYK